MKSINPIAFINSPYKEKFTTPRQSGMNAVKSIIEFNFKGNDHERLRGLNGFSHLWVIFEFHLIEKEIAEGTVVVRPPRLGGKEKTGVYATRSPHRPNRLGLSLVEIIEVKDQVIVIRGGDFVHGTPIFDIKPYLKESESIPNARSGWCEEVEIEKRLSVSWSHDALAIISDFNDQKNISEILSLDPRPSFQKENNKENKQHENSSYAVHLLNYNIHFKILEKEQALIITNAEQL